MDMFDSRKVFSVLDPAGINTLAFQINHTVEDNEAVCSIEKLKSYIEVVNGSFKKTFFFNPEPKDAERKEIVFLTLKPGEAVLNAADFIDGELHVGLKPAHIKYSSIRFDGEESEYKEFTYLPNFKRPISIVDPILGDEVRPVVYFDTNSNTIKARIKLLPNKSYIALEVGNY